MINQLAENFLHIQKSAEATPMSLEQRLLQTENGASEDSLIDQLYAHLKVLWQENPDMSSPEIIDCIRKFLAEDGTTPYKNIPTHTEALAKLMQLYKEDEGENSPIYARLNKGVGLAVVSNGILNTFTTKMLERSEEPEGW